MDVTPKVGVDLGDLGLNSRLWWRPLVFLLLILGKVELFFEIYLGSFALAFYKT